MREQIMRIIVKFGVVTSLGTLLSQPAMAQTDELPCDVPSNLQPLFALLDSFTELAFLFGVGLATLGFSVAALFMIIPGQDYTRLGKSIAKHVFIGSLLLLSAHMIVSFLVNELGATICT